MDNHLSQRIALLSTITLLTLHAYWGWQSIQAHSNVYDELAVLGSGANYVRNHNWDVERHVYPPFFKVLVGAFTESVRPERLCRTPGDETREVYACGFDYLYRNSVSPERLLTLARIPSLLASVLLGLVLLIWAWQRFGAWPAITALALYVSAPIVLTQASLSTVDMGMAAMFFVAVYSFQCFLESESRIAIACTGMFTALALLTKTPAILIFPVFVCLTWLQGYRRSGFVQILGKAILSVAIAFLALTFVLYDRQGLTHYFESLRRTVLIADTATPVYWGGQIYSGGSWWFYLSVLLVKASLSFLALLLTAFVVVPKDRRMWMFMATPVIFFVVLSFSPKQMGSRYLLPAIPFLCMLCAYGISRMTYLPARVFALLLTLGCLVEAGMAAPHFLSYFNPLAGGSLRGHRWLIDCDLDWGQDLPQLRNYWISENKPELILSLFGNADRAHYFSAQQDLYLDNLIPSDARYQHINSARPQKELLILSATARYQSNAYEWFFEHRTPTRPTASTFAFDITHDSEAAFRIGQMYMTGGRFAFAVRQFLRSVDLAPGRPGPMIALGDAYRSLPDYRKAREYYGRALTSTPDRKMQTEIRMRLNSIPQ